jgi:multidrug efflux pump subunit AcrB
VRNSFSGAVAKRFAQDAEEILVRVKLPESETINQTVRDIYLHTPDKTDILLSEVVTFKKSLGFTKIRRQDGVRQVSVAGDVDPSITTTNIVLQTVRKEIAPDIEKRFNVQIDYKGKAEEQAEAFTDMSLALVITFASIYIILAWLFSSYTTPFLVMSVVPFGLIGAMIGHYLMGFNLGMFSLLALLGLAGVLVNDSIILVTTTKRFIADGYDLSAAVIEGARERLRPVILTTLTTILGLTPILFERSLQAQLVQPLAITFVFGMLFSPFLVLFYLPAIMGIAESFKNNVSLLVLQIKPSKRQYS